jgi:hypothetical protein
MARGRSLRALFPDVTPIRQPLSSKEQPGVPKVLKPSHSRGEAKIMANNEAIREHMEVIGADGVHLGTVDKVEGGRIKLTKADSGQGSHEGHHHYISVGLVAEVEGDKVRLSANADVAVTFEEEGTTSS